ncbi:MAG: Uma2 family endonuclease [Planctomycetes bacterium]|jgi:Uma2 family endonuclease|nr:Uma2 family endonuclease [Planctomycetota bacterium]
MVVAVPHRRFKAEEVVNHMPAGVRWELVRGELLIMSPAGAQHGQIAVRIATLLDHYVRAENLGRVYAAETGFLIGRGPDSLRAPDVAFLTTERAALADESFFEGAPDLAVEIVSPSEARHEVMDKARMWIDAGTRLVWVVWPKKQQVTVLVPGRDDATLGEAEALDGRDVVPGFSCEVSAIFE